MKKKSFKTYYEKWMLTLKVIDFYVKWLKHTKTLKKLKTSDKQINKWNKEVLNIKGFRAHHGF